MILPESIQHYMRNRAYRGKNCKQLQTNVWFETLKLKKKKVQTKLQNKVSQRINIKQSFHRCGNISFVTKQNLFS